MTDRERAILLYVARFGASRASDIHMAGSGRPPKFSEIMALVKKEMLYQTTQPFLSPRSTLRDGEHIYWGLTFDGLAQARSMMK